MLVVARFPGLTLGLEISSSGLALAGGGAALNLALDNPPCATETAKRKQEHCCIRKTQAFLYTGIQRFPVYGENTNENTRKVYSNKRIQ